ncbi:hypothetical protein [Streptomyces sp. TRM68416]|uniref:hypothetical protein n=1 Tax=Streptomyces sp. TRM68416 TaxID=2758412 RepID=UPI001CB6CD7C|nr:hypothetical protein [Streptomyces sp. TRM68416]
MASELPNVDLDTIRRTCNRMADARQLTKDPGGRYYPDTETRTLGTPGVAQLSDCPNTATDLHEQLGQPGSGLSQLSDSAGEIGG